MQISYDGNYQFINYARYMSSPIWTGAFLKLDFNMDPLYTYYLDEIIVGTNHDFTTIALGSTNDFFYVGGNVGTGGQFKAAIFKLKDANTTASEQWRVTFGYTTENYCVDHATLFGEELLMVAGFTLPLGSTSCDGYSSVPNEYVAVVKTSSGTIMKIKTMKFGNINTIFTKILVDNEGYLSILGFQKN